MLKIISLVVPSTIFFDKGYAKQCTLHHLLLAKKKQRRTHFDGKMIIPNYAFRLQATFT